MHFLVPIWRFIIEKTEICNYKKYLLSRFWQILFHKLNFNWLLVHFVNRAHPPNLKIWPRKFLEYPLAPWRFQLELLESQKPISLNGVAVLARLVRLPILQSGSLGTQTPILNNRRFWISTFARAILLVLRVSRGRHSSHHQVRVLRALLVD